MDRIKTERSWDETINALQYTHTLSIKDICKKLKTTRSWVNKYVLPHIDKIYLNNGIRGREKRGINWVRLASLELDKEMTESVWCSENDFNELIKKCIVSVTKQTKRIPCELLVKSAMDYKESYEEYTKKIAEVEKEGRGLNTVIKANLIKTERDNCWHSCLSKTGKCVVREGERVISKRSAAAPVSVELPNVPIEDWIAPHDIKGYGDTDEEIYRRFFEHGYIRIELRIPNADGGVGTKVYYVPDPEPILHRYVDQYVIIEEGVWEKYCEKIKKCRMREMTPDERAEYDALVKDAEQMEITDLEG